ncbi:Eukaryotic translation initiation factor 4E1 [Gryllus bimaculatus]|nr:Eukaryotic translation initiation factor 4E1 [Gryllus bimaculatus]
MWEDKANRRGGRWVLKLPRGDRARTLDTMWEETLIAMLDGMFSNSGDICGAVLNVRGRFDKISLWVKDSSNKQSVLAIGWNLKECLCLAPDIELEFEAHIDAMMKDTDNRQ